MLRDLVADGHVAQDELGNPGNTELAEARDVEGEDNAPALARVGVAELQADAARHRDVRVRQWIKTTGLMVNDGLRGPDSGRRLALKAVDLIGTWRLRSWKNVASDGSAVDPLGERPVGYIFYNHDGYMSVEIMAAHRAPYQDPDAFGGTPEERSEAIGT